MQKPHKNFNLTGGAGCIILLLLTFLLINPLANLPANALEGNDANNDYGENTTDPDSLTMGGGIDVYATTASTVAISFSPTSANGSVTPVDAANGDKAKVDVQAKVEVKNSGGYKVYVGSSSSDLKNGNNMIPSVSSATTYEAMPLNSWGFSFRKADSSTDKTVANLYTAMPATLRSSTLDQNISTNIPSDTRYYMLSFAARISSDKPAGTYTNSVTMSVVSDPMNVTVSLADLSNMQDMTPSHCAGTTAGEQKQLKDIRDGKYYWVGKLPDGNCWMTQNLDLDLSKETTLTNADTDLQDPQTTYTPIYDTATEATEATILPDNTGQRSWSLGDYIITDPNTSINCGAGKASAADCPGQFTTGYPTPTTAGSENANDYHYILGNHYQWNAATAGTGYNITSGQATSSICPKGWRLPTSGDDSAEFAMLVAALGGTSTTNNVTEAPFYGVRGGLVWQDINMFNTAGQQGSYWSSTSGTRDTVAYAIVFRSATTVTPSSDAGRQYGRSIRCIAR